MRIPVLSMLAAISVAAGEAAPELPKLTLQPESLELQRTVRFSPQGRLSSDQQRCSISFRVSTDKRISIPEFGRSSKVSVTVAETSSGESLVPDSQERHNLWGGGRLGGVTQQYQLRLALKAPTQPCTMIQRIAGTIEVNLASDKLRKVELKPISKHTGNPIAIDGLPGVELTIERTERAVKISGDSTVFANLTDQKFYNAAGDELETKGTSTRSDNDQLERELRVTLPPDGAVVLYFLQDVKTVTLPFEVTNLALTPEAVAKPKNVIPSVEVDSIEPPAPPAGKADNF